MPIFLNKSPLENQKQQNKMAIEETKKKEEVKKEEVKKEEVEKK